MGWRSDLLQLLPARWSLPVRARYGASREPELDVLDRFVGPGDHAVDIGCHLGLYAYHLLRLSAPGGRVVGFEPQSELVGYLERAFRPQLATGRFEVRRSALGDRQGAATLTLPRRGRRLNRGEASLLERDGESQVVPVGTLDDSDLPRPVAFVKCDVEGFELAVLSGGLEMLRRDLPVLLVEIEVRHAGERVGEVFDLLRRLGYRAAVYRPQDQFLGWLDDEADPPAAAQTWVGHYVNNYFFVPAGRADAVPGTTTTRTGK